MEKGEDNRSPAGLALYVALPNCSDTASQIATNTYAVNSALSLVWVGWIKVLSKPKKVSIFRVIRKNLGGSICIG
jgi:hypothetical protein